jgi:Lrp/AsnC family leucine-responsive transcriptional regulator
MKFTPGNPTSRVRPGNGLDSTDVEILGLLQDNCKQPLASIGAEVGLSAPAVVERIHKLEDSGVIQGYRAQIDARQIGLDVTAFIGLSTDGGSDIKHVEAAVMEVAEVLECHHVTGGHTLLLKVKTVNTSSLELLIARVRSMSGVVRTETMVVLSSPIERTHIELQASVEPDPRAARRGSPRTRKRQARG